MSASGRVADFRPSTNGFHFDNEFPPGTEFTVDIPVVGTVAADAHGGICGGFVFAALDLFHHQPRLVPTSQTADLTPNTPLYAYLTSRFDDSFGNPPGYDNGVKAFAWTQTPDHDVLIPIEGPGLARRMVEQEWPAIKADIDAGNPSPLYLVMGPQSGVGDIPGIKDALSHSHQVIAYAYSLDDASNLTLSVYDCNDHDDDSSTISLNIANPAHTITISAPRIQSRFTDPHPIRGIFRSDYSSSDPTRRDVNFPTLGAPSPPSPPRPPPECASLANELTALQKQLHRAAGQEKISILQQIADVEAQMRQLGCPR